MGFIGTFAALELHDLGKSTEGTMARAGARWERVSQEVITEGRAKAVKNMQLGKHRKQDASVILMWHAERWEQAGRYDFAEQYKAMEKRVRKGAAFAVTIDPQTGEVLIAA